MTPERLAAAGVAQDELAFWSAVEKVSEAKLHRHTRRYRGYLKRDDQKWSDRAAMANMARASVARILAALEDVSE